jgi:hypothetical protein
MLLMYDVSGTLSIIVGDRKADAPSAHGMPKQ